MRSIRFSQWCPIANQALLNYYIVKNNASVRIFHQSWRYFGTGSMATTHQLAVHRKLWWLGLRTASPTKSASTHDCHHTVKQTTLTWLFKFWMYFNKFCWTYIYEVSPKFNCCKMEYLLILRFKGPLRFSMFRTRLSRKLAWPCVFLNGLRDFSWREKEALYFCLRSCKGFFNRFLSLRCSTVTLLEVGALACFYEWMDSVSDFATYAWLHFLPGQSTCCKF